MASKGNLVAVIPAIAVAFLLVLLVGGASIALSSKPEFAGHPKGLYVLFFAEMWERFSYYGMRALLVFYLTKHWLFSDGEANLIYGAYNSLVYVTPVLGGYLADRYLGQRKAVLFGAILLTIGHMMMGFEGDGGGNSGGAINVFWLALAFIIVGTGFLKANISVIVGQLYPRTDARRDGAYTIFYIGINTGATLGTILAGWLGETYGWSYGFGAAGVGMLLGLIVFVGFKPLLLGKGESPNPAALARKVGGVRFEHLLYGLGIASIAVAWALIQYRDVIEVLLAVSGVALLGYVLFESFRVDREARHRLWVILFLIALNPVFWGLFEQAGGSLNLYTDRFVDRQGVPASIFQSINPLYIVLLGPIFAWLWVWLGKRGLEPSTPAKFGLALLQVGFAFLVFVWGANSVGPAVATPVLFVFLVYLFQTSGELCLSPVGLSAMNRLSPKTLASLIMGAWFYMTAVGQFVAGKIGEATGGEGGEMTKEGTLAVYNTIGWWTIAIGVVVLALAPFVKRLMHLDTLGDDVDHALAGEAEIGEPKAAGFNTSNETR
ncbi:peptide MFS transporter [Sphingomonas sp. PL-96]|uniref:peptide MFS transporter n=1 Tax=Sphingomonas sp. PL-96 TaxID=2887201 RepID=UPI001E32943A|nr:peptide MFS transporter [Sphingomonas sp. PL-96]MCC2977471.1 peptide MFS transporter [Sphingomonas sp. PL-96]